MKRIQLWVLAWRFQYWKSKRSAAEINAEQAAHNMEMIMQTKRELEA